MSDCPEKFLSMWDTPTLWQPLPAPPGTAALHFIIYFMGEPRVHEQLFRKIAGASLALYPA
jgi:hypothetical protein